MQNDVAPLNWLFFSDNYPPETNAAASRIHERAKELLRSGHKVSVITSCPNFPYGRPYRGYQNRWFHRENMDGVEVIRIKTFMTKNEGFLLRSFDFISYVLPALLAGLRVEKPDVIVGSCPHLLVPFVSVSVARLRNVPAITEIADIWPDSAVSVGVINERGFLLLILRNLERWIYKHSRATVALTSGIRDHIQSVCGREAWAEVIENGVDLASVRPADRDDTFLLDNLGESPAFRLGYVGTLGMAQGMSELIVHFADILLEDECFIIAGPGADRISVARAIGESKCRRILLHDAVPKPEVPRLWALCDVAVLKLRDSPALRKALPSKLIEISALGVPVIYIGPEGVASQFVLEHKIGLHVQPDNLAQLRAALDVVRYDAGWRDQCRVAMAKVASTYSRQRQASRLADLGRRVLTSGANNA